MLSLAANLQTLGFTAQNRLRGEKGATAVEYGIMVALIAVVIIVAVSLLGGTLTEMFQGVNCQISSPATPRWDAAAAAGAGACAAPLP